MKLIRLIDGVVMFTVLGLTVYFMITYTGPFQWLAELQLKWFGQYWATLAFCLTFLSMGLPLRIAFVVLKSKRGESGEDEASGEALNAFLMRLPFPIWVGVGFMAFGGAMWWYHSTVGTKTQVTAAQFESGYRPPNRLVEVEGVALWDMAFGIEGDDARAYVPLVSRSWVPANGVSVYLETYNTKFDTEKRDKPADGTYWGTINLAPIHGMARVRYEKSSIPPAKKHVVIHLNDDGEHFANGKWMFLGGAIALGVGVIWMLLRR